MCLKSFNRLKKFKKVNVAFPLTQILIFTKCSSNLIKICIPLAPNFHTFGREWPGDILYSLDILFRQIKITKFIKVRVAFIFGLQTFKLIYFTKIYQWIERVWSPKTTLPWFFGIKLPISDARYSTRYILAYPYLYF